ncbi:hypothetical protein ACSBR1_006093 [Camellia fascicularis]
MDYAELLRSGFTLEWMGISCAAECENCGGHCGFNNSNSVCFCPDRPYGKRCNNGKHYSCSSIKYILFCVWLICVYSL